MASRRDQDDDDKLRRENVPGELEHASGEEEIVEASIVAGAGGEPGGLDERALEQEAGGNAAAAAGRAERDVHPKPEGNRVVNFLRASWAELQRVQWPDRRQVTQATAVVLGFVALAGGYLGLADVAAQEVVDFII
jgi:preprotein translocase subunit SecE